MARVGVAEFDVLTRVSCGIERVCPMAQSSGKRIGLSGARTADSGSRAGHEGSRGETAHRRAALALRRRRQRRSQGRRRSGTTATDKRCARMYEIQHYRRLKSSDWELRETCNVKSPEELSWPLARASSTRSCHDRTRGGMRAEACDGAGSRAGLTSTAWRSARLERTCEAAASLLLRRAPPQLE